ncbi:MAG: histidine phosphotransferase family protein [Paracoccaceae bacterium]
MPRTAIDLSALVSSRICHDLSSPIGAINNGVELVASLGGAPAAELDLISQSAAAANAKLRFFRIAFGGTRNHAEIAAAEIRTLCRDVFDGGRLNIDARLGTGTVTRDQAKTLLLLVLCLESALPLGGHVHIERASGGWRFSGEGTRVHMDPDLWSLLCDGRRTDLIGAPQVHFALARRMLEEGGIGIATDIRPNGVEIRLHRTGSGRA